MVWAMTEGGHIPHLEQPTQGGAQYSMACCTRVLMSDSHMHRLRRSSSHLEGGPVTDGVVQGEQQQIVLAAQLDQQCPDQRPLRQVEGRACLTLQPAQYGKWQALRHSLRAAAAV